MTFSLLTANSKSEIKIEDLVLLISNQQPNFQVHNQQQNEWNRQAMQVANKLALAEFRHEICTYARGIA
jgi:hypothetical protein